jgi:predicted small metal-binding protein
MRRALDCAVNNCGQHLEADNDEELFHLSRQHVQNVHPDIQISDEDLRSAIAPQIHDVQEPRTT